MSFKGSTEQVEKKKKGAKNAVFSSLTTLFTALTQSSSIMVFKCAYDETAEPKNVMPINETDYIKSYVVIERIVGITHQIITGLINMKRYHFASFIITSGFSCLLVT